VLRELMAAYDYQLKFVITRPDDLVELEEMRKALEAPADKVLLMPEGTNADTIRRRGLWLAEICKERGYRFSPRLHVDLWGDKRGV
jgi:7-carboxy-7-deazaguanine synthase